MRFILNAHRILFSLNFREIDWRSPKTWGVIALIAIVLFAIVNALTGDSAAESAAPTVRSVETATVSELMGGGATLSAVAEVRSVAEAKISPEIGGRIVRVSATLGARVGAGTILAEIENASQRAAVLQAEGAYDAAKASLAKVEGGTRDEQLSILRTSLNAAREGAVSNLFSAYNGVDTSLKDTADQMFRGIELGQIQFTVLTANQQLELEIERQRGALVNVLTRQDARSRTLTVNDDLKAELAATEAEVRDARVLLDSMLKALSDAIPNDDTTAAEIAAYKAGATAARASLTGTLSALAGSRSAIDIAEKNLEQGETGAQSEDVAASRAAVKQAQGVYNLALANLEKTIIRSPIAGTLNNFTVKLGDTVAPSQQVAIVSNNAALEAVMYVTEDDRNRIAVGDSVALEDGVKGTITRIAPALDPVTRRIEVKVGLPSDAKFLNGESVRVTLTKDASTPAISGPLAIPLTALRMEAERTIVFVVEDGRVAAREIAIGKLSGDSVQVTDGLSLDTEIIVDARGLKEGAEVSVTE